MITDRIQSLVVSALVALVLSGLSAVGAGLWAWSTRGDIAAKDKAAAIAFMQADAERRLNAANSRISDLEQQDAQRIKESQDEQIKHRDEIASVQAALQRARTERNGLRDQLASFASGGTARADDTVAACHSRAETLGVLLDEALRSSEEGAGDGERCNADLRTVLDAWPRGGVVSAEVGQPASE